MAGQHGDFKAKSSNLPPSAQLALTGISRVGATDKIKSDGNMPEVSMIKALATAAVAVALMALASPASAQYRFDRTVDPSQCHWWETCDYGGRAYTHRGSHYRCPVEVVERTAADGTLIMDRRRHCSVLRVRG